MTLHTVTYSTDVWDVLVSGTWDMWQDYACSLSWWDMRDLTGTLTCVLYECGTWDSVTGYTVTYSTDVWDVLAGQEKIFFFLGTKRSPNFFLQLVADKKSKTLEKTSWAAFSHTIIITVNPIDRSFENTTNRLLEPKIINKDTKIMFLSCLLRKFWRNLQIWHLCWAKYSNPVSVTPSFYPTSTEPFSNL